MAPIGSSISLRLIGFLLAAVVLFNLVMALAIFAPLGRSQGEGARLPLPRQMAAIVDVLDAAAPEDRPRILIALNSNTMAVSIVDALPVAQVGQGAEAGGQPASAPLLMRFLDAYDRAFATRDMHVDMQRQGLLERLGGGGDAWSAVRIFVGLADGKWVRIQPVRGALMSGILWRGLLIVGVTGLIVIVLLVIAVRQTARPIEKLASGARTFADKLDAPDLDVKGSKELRDLAAAFNDMKTRIRSLVQERTRLVAAIAHDLRTYLTRLRLRAEFISDPKQRERAEADIEEMSALIGDTLLFAKSVERQSDLSGSTNAVTEVSAFLAARREMGDPVSGRDLPAGPLVARMDPVAFRRILSNLTDNAIRYGGQAELSVRGEGGRVIIEVADRGPGIAADDLDRMLAPFERLEPSRGREAGGAGLGLAIVKALVDHHGGDFTMSNRPGGGLVARVSMLPAG
jgi:two-component system osmolarity sensor histidine kinase EnvZ